MSATTQKKRIKAIREARNAESNANFVFLEYAAIAGLAGYYYTNWWVFWGSLIGIMLLHFSPLAAILGLTQQTIS